MEHTAHIELTNDAVQIIDTNIITVVLDPPPIDIASSFPISFDGPVLAHHWVLETSIGRFGIWQWPRSDSSVVAFGHTTFVVPLGAPLFAIGLSGAFLVLCFLLVLGFRRLKRRV